MDAPAEATPSNSGNESDEYYNTDQHGQSVVVNGINHSTMKEVTQCPSATAGGTVPTGYLAERAFNVHFDVGDQTRSTDDKPWNHRPVSERRQDPTRVGISMFESGAFTLGEMDCPRLAPVAAAGRVRPPMFVGPP